MSSNEKANGNDASSDGKVTKMRKCPPRCIIYCAVSDPKDKDSKITQMTIYCLICLVSLCTKMIGNRRTTYFEHFHQIRDLSDLYRHQQQRHLI